MKAPLIIALAFISVNLYSQANLVVNGDFETNLGEWGSWFDNSNGYTGSFQAGTSEVYSGTASGEVIINSIGSNADYFRVMVKNTSFSLTLGETYDVSFYLKSESSQNFYAEVHQDTSPFANYISETLSASTAWQLYEFTFTSPVTTSDVRFTLKFGNSVANYYFDEIVIKPQSDPVYTELLNTDHVVDWSRVGVPGGIPEIPNGVVVTDFGAVGNGVTNDYNAFVNALAACPQGQAVYVPPGEYRINGSLLMLNRKSLRGACPSTTKLYFDVGSADPCIDVVAYQYGSFRNVISGFEKNSNTVTLEQSGGVVVGSYIEIQQENNPALMYTDPLWDVSWAEESVGQMFKVIAVNGNVVTLDRPVFFAFDPSFTVEARPLGLIEDVGIENLYIEKLDATDSHSISIKNASKCWVRNVESNMTFRSHIDITQSLDIEVRECYLHHSHDYGGGGHGYGVNATRHATSCLIENNIFETLRHAMLVQHGATGNVFAYNYSKDPFWDISTTNIPTDISMHGHYPSMNLFESNIVHEATFSDFWGPVGPGNTMFRNRVEQSDILVDDHSHLQNIVANELTGGSTTVAIDPSVTNTWSHSNNENGTIAYYTTEPVPASIYLTEFPEFLTGYPFPSMGFDQILNQNSIPAKDRYDIGQHMLSCICNAADTCFDDCPQIINDTHLGGGNPFLVLPATYRASNYIESSGTLDDTTYAGYHANTSVTLLPNFNTGDVGTFLVDNNACN